MKPDVLEGLPENVVKLFRELEERTMLDVVRRLKNNGNDIIRSADWQLYRLQELGMTESEIRKHIKDALELTDFELDDIYDKVIEDGFSYDDSIYKGLDVSDDGSVYQFIDGIRQQTDKEFRNITQTTGFAIDNNGKISYSSVTDVLDSAMLDISSGLFDYNTVLKRVVNQMTNSGLRTVDYASGWSNRVDVAARRAVMTGVSQLTGKINESNAEKLETDTYEVSWHSGARPSHMEWQGKWYTMQELIDICGFGTVTGLCGANCYHSYSPVVPGISKPTYTAEQLERMKREELTPREYSGKKYTKYEALQKQRRMETTMRAQRQKIKLLEEGGADEDDIINARCRYRGTSAEYSRFSKAMDLPQQRERVYIDGLGDVGKGKYTKNVLQKKSKCDIILVNKNKSEVTDLHYIGNISLETFRCITNDITTDELIITEKQIQHIFERHPNDFADRREIIECIKLIVQQPDYIIESERPFTALVLKDLVDKKTRLVVRLKTSIDPEGYKNSVITFQKIKEKEWNRIIKNKKVLYKSE